MKNNTKIILTAALFLICIFYTNQISAADPKCTSDDECGTRNCVAGQCYDNSIGSPCLSSSACASKNCYAGRCCSELYPMDGSSCAKKSAAQNIPDANSPADTAAEEPSTETPKAADTGMVFSGMTGQVECLLPGKDPEDDSNWKLAKMDGSSFPPGTHVRTMEDSQAVLTFPDMSVFILKPETEVIVATPPQKDSKIKLVAGNIWVNIKKMINEGSMEIEMNQATAGIKGTTLVLSDDGKTSTLKVIEGEVLFTSKSNGEKVNITGGKMVSASDIGLGETGTFDTAKETADWNAVSGNAEKTNAETSKEPEAAGSKGSLFLFGLYGLIGMAAIFVLTKIILRIKGKG